VRLYLKPYLGRILLAELSVSHVQAMFTTTTRHHQVLGSPMSPAGVDVRTVQEMLGHSSIVLTADTYTSVLPDVAYRAAEKVPSLVLKAGCLIPGTGRRRRRQTGRKKGRRGGQAQRLSRSHPGRQIGRPPPRRSRAGPSS